MTPSWPRSCPNFRRPGGDGAVGERPPLQPRQWCPNYQRQAEQLAGGSSCGRHWRPPLDLPHTKTGVAVGRDCVGANDGVVAVGRRNQERVAARLRPRTRQRRRASEPTSCCCCYYLLKWPCKLVPALEFGAGGGGVRQSTFYCLWAG